MRIALPLAVLLALGSYVACGFGIYADDGSVNPSPDYWGWQCADGTTPDPVAGCLPQTCDNSSFPSFAEVDGGLTCVCADGTNVLISTCSNDGTCDDASTPTLDESDAGDACVCADGTSVVLSSCGVDGGMDNGGADDGGMDDGGS